MEQRELKFRCWDDLNEQMIYQHIDHLRFTYIGPSEILRKHGVIMQWIGLKDDNGKDIFEGDIITDINNKLLAIEWNDDTCKFQFSDGSDINNGDRYNTYKVIVGNIFQNPELLNINP